MEMEIASCGNGVIEGAKLCREKARSFRMTSRRERKRREKEEGEDFWSGVGVVEER